MSCPFRSAVARVFVHIAVEGSTYESRKEVLASVGNLAGWNANLTAALVHNGLRQALTQVYLIAST